MLLGVPDFTPSHEGIDRLGARCRVDPTVSVMRFGPPAELLCLGDEVSIYGHTRLVLGDVVADPCVGIQIGSRTIINVGSYLSGEGGLCIGEDVLIGAHAKLLSAGHAIDGGDPVIARNAITRARIVVEDGAGAALLDGGRRHAGTVDPRATLWRKEWGALGTAEKLAGEIPGGMAQPASAMNRRC